MIKNTMRVKERNSICGTMIVSLVTLLVMMMTREVESNPIYDTQNLTKIVIGFSLASNSTNSNFKYHTQQAQTAINLFKSRTLNMTFQQQNLSLEVRLYHDNGPDDGYKMTKKNFQTMCNDPEIAIAIFTISTAPTNNAVPIVQQCGKIAIVPAGVNLTYFDIYQQMFQISTPSNNYIDIMLPNYRYAGIKSLALIVGANAFNIDMCNSLTPKKLKPYNLNIKSIINLSILDSSVILTPNETIQLENALQKSWESNAKSLVLCTLDVVTVAALKIIKQKSYSFESILVGPTRPTYDTVDPDLMQYVFVLNDIHPDLQLVGQDWPDRMVDLWEVVDLARRTFLNSPSLEITDLVGTLSRTQWETALGTIQYDGRHRTKIAMSIVQYVGNKSTVVWPPEAASASMILPIPTFDERIYDASLSGGEIAFMVLSALSMVISLIFILMIVIYRENSVISASAPLFLLIVCLGNILICASIFTWSFHSITIYNCHLRIWFLGIGFWVLVGPMLLKSFRVWRCWVSNLSGPGAIIHDIHLIGVILIGILGITIILTLYSAIGEIRLDILVPDAYRPKYNEERCLHNQTGSILLIILTTICLGLVAGGLILGWVTRKVPFLIFNESKILLFSMYNFTFFAFLAILVFANEENISPLSAFILKSTCIILSGFGTMSILMVNKFWLISTGKNSRSKAKETNSHSSGTKSTSGTTPSNLKTSHSQATEL